MESSSNVENFPPNVVRLVSKELASLVRDPPEGIRISTSDEKLTDIHASIQGPEGTPYEGGVFHMKLVLGKDFPAAPPKGFFLTKIFHPNVAANGEICVNTLKKDWKAELGLRHLLLTIKCLLIDPNPESALNEEAGKLLLEHYSDYCKRARMMTEVHATPLQETSGGSSHGADSGPGSKKKVGTESKKKVDKKKSLRRL